MTDHYNNNEVIIFLLLLWGSDPQLLIEWWCCKVRYGRRAGSQHEYQLPMSLLYLP